MNDKPQSTDRAMIAIFVVLAIMRGDIGDGWLRVPDKLNSECRLYESKSGELEVCVD